MSDIYNPFDEMDWASRMRIWQAGPLEHRYTPQGYQEDFHRAMSPHIKAIGGGVGAAKSSTCVQDYCHEVIAALDRRTMGLGDGQGYYGRIAITGKTYDAPRVAFRYLKQRWEALGLVQECSDPESPRPWRMVSTTGVEVLTITAKDTEGMEFASRPYTIVHITEAVQQPLGMFNAAMERVSRWPGSIPGKGKIYCEGTFDRKGYPWYAERCRYWSIPGNDTNAYFWNFPSWENGYVYPSKLVGDPRLHIHRDEWLYHDYLRARNKDTQHGGFTHLEQWFRDVLDTEMLSPEIEALFKHYDSIEQLPTFWTQIGGYPPVNISELWRDIFIPQRHIDPTIMLDETRPVHFMFDPATHRYAGLWCQETVDPVDKKPVLNFIDQLVMYKADFHKYRERWLAHPATKYVNLVVADVASRRHDQGMRSTAEWWAMPVAEGGCGHMPRSRFLDQDVGIQVMQTALSDLHYKLRFSPRCTELFRDFRLEKLNVHGMIEERINRGADDCRKAVTYYLALTRGTGMLRQHRAARPARGVFLAMPVANMPPKERSFSRES